jgi:hypothetical protein
MNLRQLLRKPLTTWQALGVIVLVFGAWFAIQVFYDLHRVRAGMEEELRSCEADVVVQELIHGTNSPMLDGRSGAFNADLAIIREGHPWARNEPPRPGDRSGCVRMIITNKQGQALHLLLQEEHAPEGVRFRLLSYKKIAQPVAPPNGGPATSVGDSGVTGGRHR